MLNFFSKTDISHIYIQYWKKAVTLVLCHILQFYCDLQLSNTFSCCKSQQKVFVSSLAALWAHSVLPTSSLKVRSNLICSGVDPPMNSVLNSRSVNAKWRISFWSDFLNHGPLSWSDRRSGIGKRTERFNAGVATCTDIRQFAGLCESSRNTSVKALC